MSSFLPDDLPGLPSIGASDTGADGDADSNAHSDADSVIDSEADAVLRGIAHAPPRRPQSTVVPGTRWSESGRYIIDRRLGRGGMGTVYAATDTVLNRVVALKVLDAADTDHDAAHHARLLREAQLAARVEHERIARVYDVGKHDGFAFVAMEYVQGGTLRRWMTGREVPLAQVVDIATQIAEGLAELHAKRVVHRDLKPENVMLTAQGGVKLLDFGLARHALASSGEPGIIAGTAGTEGASLAAASGTPGYMAPEQCNGQPIDARVDIFALGVITYELVTGERLFRGPTVGAVLKATLEQSPTLRDGVWRSVPERLRDHTARMLARDPAARFPDGASVLAALRELALAPPPDRALLPAATAQELGKAATQESVPRGTARRRRLGRTVGGLELLSAVMATALLATPRISHRPPRPPPPGMVRIDVGTIDVGRDLAEIDRECLEIGSGCDRKQMLREVPRGNVTVAPFFLDRDEVTNDEFVELLNNFASNLLVLDDEDHHYPRFVRRNAGTGSEEVLFDLNAKHGGIETTDRHEYHSRASREKLPAAQVSWYGAKLFCETHGKRLPTDDEWEAAARGREDRRFPWGNELPRCGDVVIPNDHEVPLPTSCPDAIAERAVGTAPQDVTPDGVRDLGGNVAEWTSSIFVEGDRTAHPTSGPTEAPRVIRGGSWGESVMARSSGRNRRPPSIMGANLGFRCAASAADDESQP
jgi:formylglycine-generating enzyme required for sulfatase activity/predicted Ser/Thr protein kinase